MTALSVWWRRNFGHRNDPPPILPDKVTWTYVVPHATEATISAVIDHQCGDGWRLIEFDAWHAGTQASVLALLDSIDGGKA